MEFAYIVIASSLTDDAKDNAAFRGEKFKSLAQGLLMQMEIVRHTTTRLVRSFSPPPATVEPSATPPHPKSYMDIMSMIQRGEKPPNIREAPQSQGSFAYPQENNNWYNSYGQDNGFGPASIYQSNGKGSAPWWQQKNARVTELNPEENKAEYHGGSSERFVHVLYESHLNHLQ
ncbi:hypothetical protein Tco_1248299 [Tanacetum coccineum]